MSKPGASPTAMTMSETVVTWLNQLSAALDGDDVDAVMDLFDPGAEWRDLLALSWDIRTTTGADTVAPSLFKLATEGRLSGLTVSDAHVPPREVVRAGRELLEAFFDFSTSAGLGVGVVRLVRSDSGGVFAVGLLTSLEELTGHEERLGRRRPHGTAFSRSFGGKNWLDLRNEDREYTDRSPAVLIVGGGQAGLAVGARLRALGVDALIIDKNERIGDIWRNRYHSLCLHNQTWVAHLPYMPFPDTWPTYLPKDKFAGWLEYYAEAMELNTWCGVELLSASFDDATDRWTATVRSRDGGIRELTPGHIIMATGSVSGRPYRPPLAGLDDFHGSVVHSSEYSSGAQYSGLKAIVVGTGTSGHDVAQDLHALGSTVTMVQRSPTTVVGLEPSGVMVYDAYNEGIEHTTVDLISAAAGYNAVIRSNQLLARKMLEQDSDLLDGLHRVGFRTDMGEDDTGFHLKYVRRGGGYYINVGCSDLIASGEIGVVQDSDVVAFTEQGVSLADGRHLEADLVILATGYRNQSEEVRDAFGDVVADRVGRIWGLDPTGEVVNMWKQTAQKGLWFMSGSLVQCRIYSKFLALQIKAVEEGLLPA